MGEGGRPVPSARGLAQIFTQPGGALFLQLPEETLVLGAGVVDSHGHILSDPLPVLQLDSPFGSGESCPTTGL